MKYIRTKDGRIAEIKENMVVKVCDDATRLVYKEEPYLCVLNGDDDILKQADTIEELCDFCEIEDVDNFYEIYDLTREEFPKDIIKEYLIDDSFITSIFVGLKTNEGLIYKAKMKGVLPNGEIDWELL